MGQHPSPPSSTEHDNYDPVTDIMTAELWLEDIAEFNAWRKEAAETQFDEEIAFNRQCELYQDAIRTIYDHGTAENLSGAIYRGLWHTESIFERAAQDDKCTALAMSDTGQLPPQPEAQRLIDHPILQDYTKPPSKEGRHDNNERDILAKSLGENENHAIIDRESWDTESIIKQAAQDDKIAALALVNTEQLPPRSAAQRLMDQLILQDFTKLPSKEGRHGNIDKDLLDQTIGENQYQDSNMLGKVFQEVIRGVRPRYMRYNYWGEDDVSSKTLADWSITAQPLPSPPEAELKNPVVLKTVTKHSELFKIVTRIKVEKFEKLLTDHPNPAFVSSVCKGLREGFWPFADTYIGKYPGTYDGSLRMPREPAEAKFLRDQRDREIREGRFSQSFGKDLLPGMYSSPIHVVPKRGTSDFRLITDHSSGKYPLNSMINHEDIAGMPLDDISHLGEKLLAAHAKGRKLMLWKSDVTEAYRHCPMHPHWQIKQVNTIDGERHVDRNNTFGGRASFKIWGSVNSLVMWIAEHVYKIDHPFCYNDDVYGVCDADDTELYKLYNRKMPRDQCKLLKLWDVLGIPHKGKKQLSGTCLTIIGIKVDADRMTMSLPADGKAALIENLHRFIDQPDGKSRSFSLKEFQRIAGRMNAALNVYPLLRPALNNIYHKFGEVDRNAGRSNTRILCDTAIRNDLLWALKHLENPKHLVGIRILEDARAWEPGEADITLYTSSKDRLGAFWYPALTPSIGYHFDLPTSLPSNPGPFLSALCVASAFRDATYRGHSSSKIVIYTDDENVVKMFDSFHCIPACNRLLKAVADAMIKHKYKLKVLYTPEKDNGVANFISQGMFNEARKCAPSLILSRYKHSDKLLDI